MIWALFFLHFFLQGFPKTLSIEFTFPEAKIFHEAHEPSPTPGFVEARYDPEDGRSHFYLGDRLFDFRGFNGPTFLGGTVFETEDLLRTIRGFGTPVTRAYTLLIANEVFGGHQKPKKAHILGWDYKKDDWIYNEDAFQNFDRALAMASKFGVKIIFPIINQDYGDNTTDWVGNFNDLVRHRYNISSYELAQTTVDWFTDMDIRKEFKKILFKLMTRRNTFNGRVYGEDDTIFAWETGNEMNWGSANNTIHRRPAPANWTIDIAEYIKKFSPKTMVMDGSFSRNINESAWPEETLKSDAVDIVSYHIYNDEDLQFYQRLADQAKKYNKPFVVGEHGFYSDTDHYRKAYDSFDCPGALIWSLRPHNEIGAFSTHGEGNNIYSYHVPGWERQTSTEFDTIEEPIVRITYEASYKILDQEPPIYPIPAQCYPFFATNNSRSGISWKGAAWAKHYEIWAVAAEGGLFKRVARKVFDNVEAGTVFVAIDPVNCKLEIPQGEPVPFLSHAGFVDDKWSGEDTHDLDPGQTPWMLKSNHTLLKREVAPEGVQNTTNDYPDSPIPSGAGWYSVRPISADGHPGPFSHPVYITNL